MKRSIRLILAGAILLGGLVILGMLVSLRQTPLPVDPPHPLPEVETVTARKEDITIQIPAQGVVEPVTVTRASAEVEGVVLSVSPRFHAGGEFEKGEVLVTIDPSDYEAALARAEAEAANASLALAEEEMRAKQARRDWDRLAGPSQSPTPLVLRKPQLAAAEARVAASLAGVEMAKKDLARTQLRAPYRGRLREKLVDLGSRVGRGEPIAEFYASEILEVRLPVPRQDEAFFEVADQAIELRETGGRDRRWPAKVVRTEGEIRREDRTIVIVAELDGTAPDAPLPGQFVETSLPGRVVPGIVRVPRRSFVAGDRVMVVGDDGTITTRQVDILRTERDDVLVSSGLEDGEQLCITALAAVIEGMDVKVVTRDGRPLDPAPAP